MQNYALYLYVGYMGWVDLRAAVRGACVVKRRMSSLSGTPGNACGRAQVRDGALKRGFAEHVRLHRGKDPTKRRKLETARRRGRS